MREDSLQKLRVLSLGIWMLHQMETRLMHPHSVTDGGDARCMSQLEILREFMHRLNIDTGIEHRPCDYFHWIGGVGAGGYVATSIYLLALQMN